MARFGNIVSRDTYPRVVNEVGILNNQKYQQIVEIIKNAVENTQARGKIENYKNYTTIAALSPLVLTCNPNPPDDTGFKRRMVLVHFDKHDSHQSDEADTFGKYLEKNFDILRVLGDFAASYINMNPLILKELQWEEIGQVILKAFYNYVGKEEPNWINDFVEQNALEESKNDTTIELRSYLIKEINEHYSRYCRTIEKTAERDMERAPARQDLGNTTMIDRINFCIDNDIIPYLLKQKSKQGEERVCITSEILKEISRKAGINNLNTLRDIANEIPGFSYGNRTIGEKNVKMAFGLRSYFVDFLTAKVEDERENETAESY